VKRETSTADEGLRPSPAASDEQVKPVAGNGRTQTKTLRDIEWAAERFGCTPRLIRKFVTERKLPLVRIGRLIRFRDEDLDAFEDACRQSAVRGPLSGVA
jgi:excisionase family DNA binding protein